MGRRDLPPSEGVGESRPYIMRRIAFGPKQCAASLPPETLPKKRSARFLAWPGHRPRGLRPTGPCARRSLHESEAKAVQLNGCRSDREVNADVAGGPIGTREIGDRRRLGHDIGPPQGVQRSDREVGGDCWQVGACWCRGLLLEKGAKAKDCPTHRSWAMITTDQVMSAWADLIQDLRDKNKMGMAATLATGGLTFEDPTLKLVVANNVQYEELKECATELLHFLRVRSGQWWHCLRSGGGRGGRGSHVLDS